MKKGIFLFLILAFIQTTSLFGQDIHYSMYDLSPVNLNPALTGIFDGDYRMGAGQRTQWRSVTIPYSTFSLFADARKPFKNKNISAGLLMNHDIAGDSRFKTFQFNGLGGWHFHPLADSTHEFTAGILLGITNRSLQYDALTFDNQYNSAIYQFDSGLSNGENFQRESRVYMNLQLGLSWYKVFSHRKFAYAGIGFANITKPKQSYFDVTSIQLDRRFNIHGTLNYPLSDQLEIVPSFLVQVQGKYREIIFGSEARYILKGEKGEFQAIRGGLFYRTSDAGYLSIGIDYNQWTGGISYDINLSDLNPASNYRGGLELAVIYRLKVFKPERVPHRICPIYM